MGCSVGLGNASLRGVDGENTENGNEVNKRIGVYTVLLSCLVRRHAQREQELRDVLLRTQEAAGLDADQTAVRLTGALMIDRRLGAFRSSGKEKRI